MNALWNAPISDRFSSLCARVFSPAAAILESEKTLGTRLVHPLSRRKTFPALNCGIGKRPFVFDMQILQFSFVVQDSVLWER